MNSSDLGYNFGNSRSWHRFDKENIKNAPRQKGIYVIRTASGIPFGRLHGESDIIYIGCTTSKGGLRQRLLQYFSPSSTQWTNLRINSMLKKYKMEIAWSTCEDSLNFEHNLLEQYSNDHDELPPCNSASNRRLKKHSTNGSNS
jgi:excinuclease UvrABC nuclease subunit